MSQKLVIYKCDFCGEYKEVKRTHYGTSFGYVRLICKDCAKELGAEIINEKRRKKIVSTKQMD